MKHIYSILLALFLVNFLIAQPKTLDIALGKMIEDLEIPGMSVAVSQNGELLYSQSVGFADLKSKRKVNKDTKFRMASVSKLFAAGAIAKLLDEGKISINDPIEKYILEYPHKGKGVTIRRILNHSSGVRHYDKKDRFIDIRNYETTDQALGIFMDDDLLSKAGTTYKYSTHAFTLLAAVVERVSGMTYTDYLQKEFFDPLHMTRSGPDIKGSKDDNQSLLYNGMKKSKLVDNPSYKRAGGGMLSTAEDLVKFGEIHMKSGFFKPSTLDSLFRPTFDMSGAPTPTQIGMAWRITKNDLGETIYHHAGSMNGARSFLMLSPADNTVIAVMTNNRALNFIDHVAKGLKDAVLRKESTFPKTLTFEKNCKIDLEDNAPYYIASLHLPEIFNEPKRIKMISSMSADEPVLKNLKVENGVSYMEVTEKKLVVYIKNSDGKWERKEYMKM